MSKHQEQIIAAAKGKVDEQLLAAAWAKPRGAGTAAAGGGLIASEIGARWAGKQRKGGDAIGIKLGNPGAVAVTATSLVTMEVGVSMGGAIKEVKEVLSTVPLAEIDTIEVKRMGLTGVMEITAGDRQLLQARGQGQRHARACRSIRAREGSRLTNPGGAGSSRGEQTSASRW
jgi:hypothetical protein